MQASLQFRPAEGPIDGYLYTRQVQNSLIFPSSWDTPMVFTVRSRPDGQLPSNQVETLVLDRVAELVMTSLDPDYNSVTQVGINGSTNPLADPARTQVSFREIIEPLARTVETVLVPAPVLTSSRILEAAEAAVLQFDVDTNTPG